MKTENKKPKLKEIKHLSPDAQNYSYGSCGCGCGCGSRGSCGNSSGCGVSRGTGDGSSPENCMSEQRYWELCLKGELTSSVYVCGWGYTAPSPIITGCGSGGCGEIDLGDLGSGPDCCMPLDLFLDLDNRNLLKSEVYVCGEGWRQPRFMSYDSWESSCGYSGSLFNIDAAVDYLISNAQSSSVGSCAMYVRQALEAGGFSTDGRPASACDYDTYLESRGFHKVSNDNYEPRKGDIVVHEATEGHPYGHIAMYSGTQWISDFVQRDMFGGQSY